MIQAKSNNFGAGSIQFKDYQTPNYIILNGRIEFNTTHPDYLAADHLEIKVPDLSLDRSAEGGIFLRALYDHDWYGTRYINDFGTVLRSWIQDKNTICIEKLDAFDEYEEQILYFQTLYAQKHKDGLAVVNEDAGIKMIEGEYPLVEGSHHSIVTDNWVFWLTGIDRLDLPSGVENFDIELENMPDDVDVLVPFASGYNSFVSNTTEMSEMRIRDGKLSSVRMTRNWQNYSNPFLYGFFVRG